jgi:tetratricopeptide (TPR) repeat protein
VFEHALSWCLSKITKKLNVYSGDEKIDTFFDLYKKGIDIDPNSLIQTLNAYRDYVKWCNDHFNVANYFYYDEHLPRIEKYILNLPIFSQQTKLLSWQDNFDIDFDTWNRCRYMESDLGTLALDRPEKFAQLSDHTKIVKIDTEDRLFLAGYHDVADPSWPAISTLEEYKNLPAQIREEVEGKHGLSLPTGSCLMDHIELSNPLSELLPVAYQDFLNQHQHKYQTALTNISTMVDSGIIINPPPVKKQTLAEKKHIIKNYNHLLEVYNQWIRLNPDIGLPLEESTLDQFAQAERARWIPSSSSIALPAEQTPD